MAVATLGLVAVGLDTAPAWAVAGASAAGNSALGFVAKLDVGGLRSCSGALIDPSWIVTARSCFADGAHPVVTGPPAEKTAALVGRPDLTKDTGRQVAVVELVVRTDRNLVLARVARPVTDVTPIKIGAAAEPGEALTVAGFGRTAADWVPDEVHTSTFSVQTADTTTVGIVGASAEAGICRGDAGGPAWRQTGSGMELVAVHSASWRRGCLGEEAETRPGALESRVDDLSGWIKATVDAAEADRVAKEARTREILEAAQRDGFQPRLVAAAKAALADPILVVLSDFLATGQAEAAARDIAEPTEAMVVELKGQQSGRCIQGAGLWGQGAESNGAGTELWDCVLGNKQRWVLHDEGSARFSMENVNSHKCLAPNGDGMGDGQALAQFDCAHTDAQRWELASTGTGGMVQLRNVRSGKLATAVNGGIGNATPIAQLPSSNAANQAWRIIDVNHTGDTVAVQPTEIEVQGVPSQRCIQVGGYWDVPNQGALADGAVMELWDCVAGSKMRWSLIDFGDNKYALKNALSGKCLDVQAGTARDGVALVQLGCHLAASQQWVFVSSDNGSVKLQSVLTGGIATVRDAGTGNGALVQQFADAGGVHQRWKVLGM